MIFAAGLGTRLHPLTDHMPKALVPVGGVPMLQRVILRLKEAGFENLVINIHHFGNQILDFLKANQDFGVHIQISDERGELLDTGGGIRKARPLLDDNEPFLVHNVDILSDIDLAALYHLHMEHPCDATLLTNHRQTSRYLLADTEGRLRGWINKSTGEVLPAGTTYTEGDYTELAFGCIHVLSPTLFRYMEDGRWQGKFSIIPFYIEICRKANICCHTIDSPGWFDIGKPETLIKAETYLREKGEKKTEKKTVHLTNV